jgi:uncharacterized protein YktA (UPF0223 family)
MMPDKKKAEYWCQRYQDLDQQRGIWKERWQTQAEFVYPSRSNITREFAKGQTRQDGLEVVDSTAIRARSMLSASLHGVLTSPVLDWFALGVKGLNLPEDYDLTEIERWSGKVEMIIRDEFAESNFYPQMREYYNELVTFGIAGLYVEDAWDMRNQRYVLNFDTLNCKELIIEEDNLDRVDVVIRPFKMTVRNILKRWPQASEIPAVRTLTQSNKEHEELEVLHCVYERMDEAMVNPQQPWVSLYLLLNSKDILNTREDGHYYGYSYFPYLVTRWDKPTNEVYSDCPTSDAIYDIMSINKAWKSFLDAFDTLVRPPILAEAGIIDGDFELVPGAFNEVSNIDRIKPLYENNPNVQIAYQIFERLASSIDRTYMIDQLQFPPLETQGTPITATEVQARFEMMSRILGPMFGRFTYELLKPLIDTVYHILAIRPQSPIPVFPIQGYDLGNLDIEYIGPLRVAQEMPQVVASQEMIVEAVNYQATTGQPIFSLDAEKYFRMKAKRKKVFREMVRTEAEEKKLKQQYQQQQQAAYEAQVLQQYAKAGQHASTAIKTAQGQ